MLGLLDYLKLGAGAIVGASLMAAPAYLYGQHIQRQATAVEALTKSVEVLRERNAIDEEVSASDAAALCRSYGLPDDQIPECMRRVVEVDPDTRNGS